MDNKSMSEYLAGNKFRSGRKSGRNGILGITAVQDSPRSSTRWICLLPACLGLPSKRFGSAVEAASYYNSIVTKHFGQNAVLCDIAAAHRLDKRNG